MWQYIEESHREILKQNGLCQLQDFMTFEGGKVLKQLPSRTILKIELHSNDGLKSFFLKRHKRPMRLIDIMRSLISGFSLSWGRKEWEVIHAFNRSGIPTVTPVAAGEGGSWFPKESFLMTEELKGFCSLELFFGNNFDMPLSSEMMHEKRAIIKELAQITRIMHLGGFNHRDFYCCHIFIRSSANDKRDWRVLDLQRVDRRQWFRQRWIIKDLAALNYSAPSPLITRTDRLRFLRHYLGQQDYLKKRCHLIRQVARKTLQIKQHDRKLQERKRTAQNREGRLKV